MCTTGACILCYESYPPPIQSGCGCRAGNELAHLDCLVKLASFQHAHRGAIVWDACQTCKRSFDGEMRNRLAIARVLHVMSPHIHMSSVRALFVEKLPAILDALELSEFRMTEERYAEAEQITRALMGPIKHLLGYHSRLYFECEAAMALSLTYTGKHSESNWRFEKVIQTSTSFVYVFRLCLSSMYFIYVFRLCHSSMSFIHVFRRCLSSMK